MAIKTVLIPGGVAPLQYVLTADRGVYRSTDNGLTWQAVNNGLPFDGWGRSAVQALAVDEGDPSIAYAGIGDLERSLGALHTGLYLTEDAGGNWLGVGRDMAGKEVQAIAVMPALFHPVPGQQGQGGSWTEAQPSAAQEGATPGSIVCVATAREIYRSVDGERSWTRLDWRGVNVKIVSLAIYPGNPDVIYVGTQGGGIYGTRDGGVSWTEMNQGLDDLEVYDIIISVADPDVIYLATNGAVYKSVNAGSTWAKRPLPTNGQHVNVIAVHPRDSNTVYVGLQYGAAYYSMDGGMHWTPLKKGLGNATVFSLALDPRDPSALWAGTTDGVWRYVFGVLASPAQGETETPTPVVPVASTTPSTTATPQPTPSATATPSPSMTLTPTVTLILPSDTQAATPTPSPQPTLTPTSIPQRATEALPTQQPTATATVAPPPSPLPPPTETPVLR